MSKNIKVEVVGGGDLPEGVSDAIAEALGLGGGDRSDEFKAATFEQVQHLITAANNPKPKVGDVVVLTERAKEKFKWPKVGERCIVTQSLDKPIHVGDPGQAIFGRSYDMAIAILSPDGEVLEYMHDSRDFEVVGSALN